MAPASGRAWETLSLSAATAGVRGAGGVGVDGGRIILLSWFERV